MEMNNPIQIKSKKFAAFGDITFVAISSLCYSWITKEGRGSGQIIQKTNNIKEIIDIKGIHVQGRNSPDNLPASLKRTHNTARQK
jgi:hypothetical protein